MSSLHPNSPESVQLLLKNGLSYEQVREQLRIAGVEEHLVDEMISSLKKEKHAAQQRKGFMFLAIGSFLCFISCIFTMLHLFPALTGFFLYGLTSIGVIILFAGLVMVFE